MRNVSVYFFLLVLFDLMVISDIRQLLLFSIGGIKRSSKRTDIYKKQSLWNRITLMFLPNIIKDHRRLFNIFFIIYIVDLLILIPQYYLIIKLVARNGISFSFIYFCPMVIKGIICMAIGTQVDSSWRLKNKR